MRQLMRPLICSNVLALRLALVVGISFLACNTFSSKLILTSHESLTYFLYFSPHTRHLRFLLWFSFHAYLYSVVHERNQILSRKEDMINTRPTIPDSSLQFAHERGHTWWFILSMAMRGTLWASKAQNDGLSIAHAYHHIVVHVSRQCDNYLVFEAPANRVDVYHNVVVCILFLYPSSCYGRLGFIPSLLHNALWVNYITL